MVLLDLISGESRMWCLGNTLEFLLISFTLDTLLPLTVIIYFYEILIFFSNPKAQLAALEHGAMQILLRQISFSNSERLRKTALFALSALVRTNSKSQIVFLKLDGLKTLMKLIEESQSKKLKIKAVTLISDLVVEQNDVKQSMVKNGKMSENERFGFDFIL